MGTGGVAADVQGQGRFVQRQPCGKAAGKFRLGWRQIEQAAQNGALWFAAVLRIADQDDGNRLIATFAARIFPKPVNDQPKVALTRASPHRHNLRLGPRLVAIGQDCANGSLHLAVVRADACSYAAADKAQAIAPMQNICRNTSLLDHLTLGIQKNGSHRQLVEQRRMHLPFGICDADPPGQGMRAAHMAQEVRKNGRGRRLCDRPIRGAQRMQPIPGLTVGIATVGHDMVQARDRIDARAALGKHRLPQVEPGRVFVIRKTACDDDRGWQTTGFRDQKDRLGPDGVTNPCHRAFQVALFGQQVVNGLDDAGPLAGDVKTVEHCSPP